MKTGKSVKLGPLVQQEDRDYRSFAGVWICVCDIICKTKEICKSKLTELKVKNASCLKGKKMGIRKCFLQGGD